MNEEKQESSQIILNRLKKHAIDFYQWAKENRHLEYRNAGPGFESRHLTAEEMYDIYDRSGWAVVNSRY